MDPENWTVFSVIFGDQARHSRNVDKGWQWGTWPPSASFYCRYLTLIFCLLSAINRWTGHPRLSPLALPTSLWSCYSLGLVSSSICFHSALLEWASSLLYFMSSSHHYQIQSFTLSEMKRLEMPLREYDDRLDFCWYFITSNYQNIFCEFPKLATPILLPKAGKNSPIHIWKSCISLGESFISIL